MSEKKKKRQKNNKFIIGFAIFLVVIFVGIGAFFTWVISSIEPIEHEALGIEASFTISYFLGTELPANASEFYARHTQWQGVFADMRFSAPSDELQTWLENNTFCTTLQEGIFGTIPDNYFNVDWWQAEEALTYTLYAPCGENPTYIVMVDQTNDDIWIIYIQYTSS